MATLRELREQARSMDPPISFEKGTTKEQLEEMIAERMALDSEKKAEMAADEGAPAEAAADIAVTDSETGTTLDVAPPTSVVDESAFSSDVKINEGDLNKEFVSQAALFAKYAMQEARAQGEVIRTKFILEVTEAEVASKIREGYRLKDQKITEKQLEAEVLKNPAHRAAYRKYLAAKESAEILRAAKDAFAQRKDMLVQLGLTKRQEADQNSLSLREKVKEVVAGGGKRTPVAA
jgi:hypothetical protein